MAEQSLFATVKNWVGLSDKNSSKETLNDISGFFNGKNSGILNDFFGTDVFNEERMTPHNEMRRVREMIDNNAQISSSLSTYQNIFLGEKINIESEDEETRKFFNEEWPLLPSIVNAIGNGGAGEHYKGIGNSYYHVKRGKASGLPKEVELIAKPENMWIRKNPDGSVKDYVLEVPTEIRDQGRFETEEIDTYTVGYGGRNKDTVVGIRYEKQEIIHIPQGRHQIPPYGRSDLASASSDQKILREIERSYGILARHKQVPKIMWILKDRETEGPLDADTFQDVKQNLNNLSDMDNAILNGNVDAEKLDYSYGGAEINMQETIDYLKRKITSPILPQFMIHGDMTTNAVSSDQLAVFFQEVRGDRHTHIEAFKPLFEEIAEAKGLSKDIVLSFGDLDLDTEKSRKQKVVKRWEKGLLTLNEARQMLGLPEDENFPEDPYKWEVQSPAAAPEPGEKLKKLLKNSERDKDIDIK